MHDYDGPSAVVAARQVIVAHRPDTDLGVYRIFTRLVGGFALISDASRGRSRVMQVAQMTPASFER